VDHVTSRVGQAEIAALATILNTTSMPNELADALVGWCCRSGGEANAGALIKWAMPALLAYEKAYRKFLGMAAASRQRLGGYIRWTISSDSRPKASRIFHHKTGRLPVDLRYAAPFPVLSFGDHTLFHSAPPNRLRNRTRERNVPADFRIPPRSVRRPAVTVPN
jgi:hypothetical protein